MDISEWCIGIIFQPNIKIIFLPIKLLILTYFIENVYQ